MKEFYPFYLSEHRKPGNRVLHFMGTTCFLLCLILAFEFSKLWLLFLGIVLAYGCAWTGHFVFEKNRPATFKYPFFSLAADFRLYFEVLVGLDSLLRPKRRRF